MGFACAGVVTPVVAPYSRSVEVAITGSGIAAQHAGSDGDKGNCGRRTDATKGQKQAN